MGHSVCHAGGSQVAEGGGEGVREGPAWLYAISNVAGRQTYSQLTMIIDI